MLPKGLSIITPKTPFYITPIIRNYDTIFDTKLLQKILGNVKTKKNYKNVKNEKMKNKTLKH